ncbi:hypothetical protein E1B28_007126 [Marasmius oreades]|uniref:Phosphatidate phosphatase APP1 catalytic domain-containing protein n=1 Tax=Marasmius oreades TaxID=181124 RepID=A0A9P7S2P7_9AGAR|nr:uncharacterized protein E1B28_007126 [Marasmius oreades]KAG7093448.1 hypothetical protein E1B28_007126 [Marasmius oreades]
MSEDMRGSSWRSLAASAASSRLTSFKGYLAQKDFTNSLPSSIKRQLGPVDGSERVGNKQSWREWAGQKISRGNNGKEEIAMFPGWATRKPLSATDGSFAFEVDIFISGFASAHRGQELASRSQRTFMRLAKGFAALPKLGEDDSKVGEDLGLVSTRLTPSTEELLRTVNLPPRPEEMTMEREIEMLERQFKRLNSPKQNLMDSDESSSSRSSSPELDSPPPIDREAEKVVTKQSTPTAAVSIPEELVRKLHANLEARLLPFWSSVLPGRMVRIRVFAKATSHDSESSSDHQHLATTTVQTGVDGSFQTLFRIGWEDMCQHPAALDIAFGDPSHEHELSVTAELFPNQKSSSSAASSSTDLTSTRSVSPLPPTAATSAHVPLTHSPIRVISDIDDTVKHSDIIGGARSVFRNVFVNELEDLVIPGMGEWYSEMWKKGVRFHYVSNGPFELLPILGDFFAIANLPPGSIKLKSYAGRSLFSGLLSAPAARKRAGVQDILNAFPDSSFILVGDSGEQDLELYTELAKENPRQILAVFIRDTGSGDILEDPTGLRVLTATPEISLQSQEESSTVDQETWNFQHYVNGDRRPAPLDTSKTPHKSSSWPVTNETPTTPGSISNNRNSNYFKFTSEPEPLYDSSRNSSLTSLSSIFTRKTPATRRESVSSNASSYFSRTPKSAAANTSTSSRISESEKRRQDLQMRVYRSRTVLPDHVVLRVFRSPTECVEADMILASS